MQRLLFHIILFLIVVLYGCKNDGKIPINKNKTSFAREIPIEKSGRTKGETDYMYHVYNKFSNELGLDFIKNGFDSLQVRVWLGHSMAKENQIVILKCTQKSWTAELVVYSDSGYDVNRDGRVILRDTLVKKSSKLVSPKSGWQNFIAELTNLNILTLPNASDLPDYLGGGADGIGYYFEVSTNNYYRFFYYENPETQIDKFEEAKTVVEFSKFLEDQFGFSFIRD